MDVLERVPAEARSAAGPVRLRELAHRGGVEESALRGMVDILAHKGFLSETQSSISTRGLACYGAACDKACVGISGCPFIAETPTSYRLEMPRAQGH